MTICQVIYGREKHWSGDKNNCRKQQRILHFNRVLLCDQFQHILLQNGGKLHVKDIADGIAESGLVPPRSVLNNH